MADIGQSPLSEFLRQRKDLVVPVFIGLLMVVSIVVSMTVEPQGFPTAISDNFPFAETVNDGEDWLRDNIQWLTRAISGGIRSTLDTVEEFLILLPWSVVVLANQLVTSCHCHARR